MYNVLQYGINSSLTVLPGRISRDRGYAGGFLRVSRVQSCLGESKRYPGNYWQFSLLNVPLAVIATRARSFVHVDTTLLGRGVARGKKRRLLNVSRTRLNGAAGNPSFGDRSKGRNGERVSSQNFHN